MEINSLNMLKFSRSRLGKQPFSVYWVSASSGKNIDNLNSAILRFLIKSLASSEVLW